MDKIAALGLTAVCTAFFGTVAHGGTDSDSWYLAPQVLGVWADEDRAVDDETGLQLALGRVLNDKWDVELAAFQSSHDGPDDSELKLRGLSLGVHRVFYRDGRTQSYFALAVGHLDSDDDDAGGDDSTWFAAYGLGLLADLSKRPEQGTNLQLRAEILGRRAFDSPPGLDEPVDYVAGIGLQYSWGAGRSGGGSP